MDINMTEFQVDELYNTSSENDFGNTTNYDLLDNFTDLLLINDTNVADDTVLLPVLYVVLISAVLSLIMLATIVGNVFVIAAILLEKNLQTVGNYLVLSLAVADLMVACLVMPLGAVYEVTQEWILGAELCEIWTCCDVLCCTASILHLVAIALDRYWAVTNVDYVRHRSSNKIGLMILLVWGVGLLVSLAPVFGWKDEEFLQQMAGSKRCLVSQDAGYQVFATCATFYVPLVVILILYWRIYQVARKRIRHKPGSKSSTVQPKKQDRPLVKILSTDDQKTPSPDSQEPTTTTTTTTTINTSSTTVNGINKVIPNRAPTKKAKKVKNSRETVEAKRERKAAKTLAIITGVFVICWLPFFVTALLMAVVQSWDPNPYLFSFFLWLGYVNSLLNPIIYTIFSPDFRIAFKKRVLCGRQHRKGLR